MLGRGGMLPPVDAASAPLGPGLWMGPEPDRWVTGSGGRRQIGLCILELSRGGQCCPFLPG